MDWFATIKRYYDLGIYTNKATDSMYVGKFVEYGKITAAQYKDITGDTYQTA